MRFAYADPPYEGMARKHYADHPDYAGEVDHPELIQRLVADYPDGWALSMRTASLRRLLLLIPEEAIVLAWLKPFCAWKRNVYPARSWEPVVLCGGRNRYGERQTPRDWHDDLDFPVTASDALLESMAMERGVSGAKPERFCHWIFDCLGATPDDQLHDLFPGSGAVARAWEAWCRQRPLAFPSELQNEPLFDGEAA